MRFLIIALSVVGILVSANVAKADRRVAFVVGNGTYKNVAQLPNPPIDAKAMAGMLRNAGFDVVEGINLTRDKMTERLLARVPAQLLYRFSRLLGPEQCAPRPGAIRLSAAI